VRAQVPPRADLESLLKSYKGKDEIAQGEHFEATVANIEKNVARVDLAPGIKAAFLPKQTRGDLVQASLFFRYGTEEALTGHNEAMSLIPQMLMRGTTQKSYEEIQDTLDVLQSTVNMASSYGCTIIDITSDKANILKVIELVAEMLKRPAFSAAEFDIVRKKEIAELEEAKADPQRAGFNELERLRSPWPKSSIHYVTTIDENIDIVKDLTVSGLKKLHETFYNANHLELSVVGAFDVDAVKTLLVKEFAEWKSATPYKRVTRPFKPAISESKVVSIADKQMAIVAMATNIQMRDDNSDYPALRFANYIFGESMKSRLMLRLREKEGLSYGAGSWLEPSKFEENSSLTMYAMAATPNAEKALGLMSEEYSRFLADGVKNDELTDGKVSFKARFENLLASDRFIVRILASDIEVGRTLRFQEAIVDAIQKLTPEQIRQTLAKFLAPATVSQVKAGDF
jgi:zinc protease